MHFLAQILLGFLAPIFGKYAQAALAASVVAVLGLGLYLLADSYVEKGKAIERARVAAATSEANDRLAALETEARRESADSDLPDILDRGLFALGPGALAVADQGPGADQRGGPAAPVAPAPRPRPDRGDPAPAEGSPAACPPVVRDRQALFARPSGGVVWLALILLAVGVAALIWRRK